METRSNHILVGGVVLALTLATAVFILWIARLGGGDRQPYDIFFKTSVEGLAKGSSVTYSGVPVGTVDAIALVPDNPEFVRVRIVLNADVPILTGTTATIAGVGFTGVSQINLVGGVKGAPPITEPGPFGAPVIPTKPGALGQLLSSAPQLLERLTTLTERLTELLSDRNQASIAGILANTNRISAALAERSPEIAATLVETRNAVRQAGAAAEAFGALAKTMNREGEPLLADLRKAAASADRTLTTLDATLADARPGVQAFSKQTLPEVGALVRDLRTIAESLSAISSRLENNPAGALIGGRKLPDYDPDAK